MADCAVLKQREGIVPDRYYKQTAPDVWKLTCAALFYFQRDDDGNVMLAADPKSGISDLG
jgi:hypothetical protein